MPEYLCRGQQQLNDASALIAGLSPTKIWRINVSAYRQRRSLDQNAYWQVLTREIARFQGENHDKTKDDLRIKFGFFKEIERDGFKFLVLKETHTADVAEMSELLEQVEAWAAQELGVSLG